MPAVPPNAAPWGPPPSVPPPPSPAPSRAGPEGWYLGPDGTWWRSSLPPAPGWWLASDLRWYPPELLAGFAGPVDRPRWGLGDVAWGFLVFAVGNVVVGLAIALAFALVQEEWPSEDDIGLSALAFGMIANVAAFAGVPWLASRRKGSGSLTRDFGLSFRPVDLAIGAGFGFGALVVAGIVGAALTAVLDPADETSNIPVDDLNGPGEIVVFALVVAVLTPIIEELFFRGLLSKSLAKRGARPVTDFAVTTLVFVLPHLLSEPSWPNVVVLFAVITCFGMALHAAAIVTRGRLGAPIVAHMIVNGAAVLTLAVR